MENTELEFPREITFKTVFRTGHYTRESISCCLTEYSLNCEISERPSEKGNFISFTVTAHYPDETTLNDVCSAIKCLDGYMMMI